MPLPYAESLGALLESQGHRDNFIIGDETGREEIEWVTRRARDIDLEVTTHPEASTRLLMRKKRPDGECVHEHPIVSTPDGTTYILLSAAYREKSIIVSCNVVRDEECSVRQISVQELRGELGVPNPRPTLSSLFPRRR